MFLLLDFLSINENKKSIISKLFLCCKKTEKNSEKNSEKNLIKTHYFYDLIIIVYK